MKHFHILIWFDSYNNPEISQMDIITFYRWKTNDSHKFTHLISGEVTTQIIQVFFLLHQDWVLSISNYLLANLTKALYFYCGDYSDESDIPTALRNLQSSRSKYKIKLEFKR